MEYLKILLTSAGSLVALFISSKVIGNKQMAELNMFDYINGITIGSIAAEMAVNQDSTIDCLLAMAVYTFFIWLISFVSQRNIKLRRFLTGRSVILMENGKVYCENFRKTKIDMNEFLSACRAAGYFNLDEISLAVMEQSGKISFMPTEKARPVTTQDLNLLVKQEKTPCTVILDGKVIEHNLKHSGYDRKWLEKELRKQNINSVNEVFIAICTDKLSVYKKNNDGTMNDIFQ